MLSKRKKTTLQRDPGGRETEIEIETDREKERDQSIFAKLGHFNPRLGYLILHF